MSDQSNDIYSPDERSNWIRLRTLVVLRWFAISGQIIAIFVAYRLFNLNLELGLCFLAIGAAIIGNLFAIFVYPENKRLREREAFQALGLDILQLGFLLYLTGGMHNPFSLLMLAPVTIGATALNLRYTVLLGSVAIMLVTVLTSFHIPLSTKSGTELNLPDLFLFGFWLSVCIGIVFLSLYARRVTDESNSMSEALVATQMALAREQKLTDLGGVVAAAAHELGTPLATIKLASSELIDELENRKDLQEDATLIRDQADRCRDILRSMGQAGKDDLHLKRAPLETVIQEAAMPHLDRGKQIHFDFDTTNEVFQPHIHRRPEIIHGLRNLVQNAVDFAKETVWISTSWSEDSVTVKIVDDGRGFPHHVLGRIGDPFVKSNSNFTRPERRPGYDGMGLGLFIAKTLLERTKAELEFANDSWNAERPSTGAIVQVKWRTKDIVSNEIPTAENIKFS